MRSLFTALALVCVTAFQFTGCEPAEQESPPVPADDQAAAAPGGEKTGTPEAGKAGAEATGDTTASETAAPAADIEPTTTEPSVDCQQQILRIRALAAAVPRIFLDLKRKPDEIDSDIIECTSLCQDYLKSCTGTPAASEVKGVLARMLLGRYDRVRFKLKSEKVTPEVMNARLTEYRAEIRDLANAAVNDAQLPPFLRADSLRVLIEMSEREREFDALRRYATELMQKYPDFDLLPNSIYSHGRSLLSQGRYEDALDFARKIVETRHDDDALAIYNIILFEAMTGIGDIEGMEDLMETILIEYPERLPVVETPYLSKQYDQWINVAEFWIGFCRFARGDASGAREAFDSHRARVESLAARLAEKGEKLDPVVGIFLEMRTRDLLTVLDQFHGRVPAADMNFGDSWLTKERFTLAEARGDVVAVMFRRPGDRRSQNFFVEMGNLLEQYGNQGLRAVSVAYLMGTPNPQRDAEKAQEILAEMERLEIRMPAAFDPDRKKQSFFRALHGTIGPSASCVLIDREGRIAWFKADPRDMDKKILRKVVERLLGEG